MTHYASSRFWRAYQALPKEIRELANAKYELLKADPEHPSLHFKKIGSYWSVRVGIHYRALAVESDDGVVGSGLAHTPTTMCSWDANRLVRNRRKPLAVLGKPHHEGGHDRALVEALSLTLDA